MIDKREAVIRQLQEILDGYDEKQFSGLSLHDNHSTIAATRFIARSRAVVDRIAGRRSTYMQQVNDITGRTKYADEYKATQIVGVLEALKADVECGYLVTVQDMAHAEVFSDYLDMADHLLNNGYKDPAAVLVGSTLESHLRQMCVKAEIGLEDKNHSGEVRQRTAARLNDELTKAQVYGGADKKQVDAWLDLRNKAAHGKYAEYETAQIKLMSAGVRDFIRRFAA